MSNQEIAIIGMSGKIGSYENIESFWNGLMKGYTNIDDFPEDRREKVAPYLATIFQGREKGRNFLKGSYLREIDQFDHALFKLSRKEASLMDPMQRVFLEVAWSALEDGGYGGVKLRGSQTGVFVGLSNTNGVEYIDLIDRYAEDQKDLATAGNLKSIMASRINYLMDLKGPSMVIDTACSSSLVAIHTACKSLRNEECEYAIAGGVKLNIVPGVKRENPDIDIIADDGITRSFDNDASGTGIGEGVAALLLKPLHAAAKDGDQIYAVIKGSAMNQDGASLGITAPNSKAQEEVLVKAWEDAGIDPSVLSYIEAHGTGTKLGDPVEIKGITNAFRRFTDRRQFCAIASLKSNIGHLDAAAGIAGVIKAALALQNQVLPPTVNFQEPNKLINFIGSPVYVNDRLNEWEDLGHSRTCGVSSFGLSGTNVHIVLEEFEALQSDRSKAMPQDHHILTLSAMTRSGVKQLVEEYAKIMERPEQPLADLCYTANTGRGAYKHRLSIVFSNADDLVEKLTHMIDVQSFSGEGISYHSFNPVRSDREVRNSGDVPKSKLKYWTKEAGLLVEEWGSKTADKQILEKLGSLYTSGADVNWEGFYQDHSYQKVRLPGYPFMKEGCWLEMVEPKPDRLHPLVHSQVVESPHIDVYRSFLRVHDQWEIGEHLLRDKYLMVGMAYVEMAAFLAGRYAGDRFQLKDLVCETPLFMNNEEEKEIEIIVTKNDDEIEFSIMGKNRENERFEVYCRGIIKSIQKSLKKFNQNRQLIMSRCEDIQIKPESYLVGNVRTSERWMNLQELYIGEKEALGVISLQEQYRSDQSNYHLYPALLDSALNAANSIAGKGTFLPWYYTRINVYERLPDSFTTYIKLKDIIEGKEKVLTFDIQLIDDEGNVIVEVEDYTVKRVDVEKKFFSSIEGMLHESRWVREQRDADYATPDGTTVILFRNEDEITLQLKNTLLARNANVIEVIPGQKYEKVSDNRYVIQRDRDSYSLLFDDLSTYEEIHIIHGLSIMKATGGSASDPYRNGLDDLFYIMKELMNRKHFEKLTTTVLADQVFPVTRTEIVNPFAAATFGMAKSLNKEYPKMNLTCIDTDHATNPSLLLDEMVSGNQEEVSFRNHHRYIQQFFPIDSGTLRSGNKRPVEGAVLITGGLGGMGTVIAEYLVSKQYKKMVLIGRRDSVPEERLKWLDRLRSSGAEVDYIQADISDYSKMEEVTSDVRRKHGAIIGIIHAAGIAGSGLFIHKEKSTFDEVLLSKVRGTMVLNDLCQKDELEFFIMCSSLTAEFGSVGQADYAAANAFQDAYSFKLNAQGVKALAIDWCGWNESGMALEYGINNQKNLFRTINNEEGAAIFDLLFLSGYNRVLVMEKNKVIPVNQQAPNPAGVKSGSGRRQVVLLGKEERDITPIERELAEIWSSTLGEKEIDVRSKFFEIGGDSISATYLLRKINHKWKDVMDITDIFNYSSILEMGEYVAGKTQVAPVAATIEREDDFRDILSKLASGQISLNEAQGKMK